MEFANLFAPGAFAILVQVITLGNFTTSKEDENDGLDRTEHGEVGFDFGGIDAIPVGISSTPKSANSPSPSSPVNRF